MPKEQFGPYCFLVLSFSSTLPVAVYRESAKPLSGKGWTPQLKCSDISTQPGNGSMPVPGHVWIYCCSDILWPEKQLTPWIQPHRLCMRPLLFLQLG